MSTEQLLNDFRMLEAHHTAAAKLATGLRKELEKGLTGPVSGSSEGPKDGQLEAMAAAFRQGCLKPKKQWPARRR